ncbi:hypothetical protein IJ531_01440 [bacterium]|nr:hypothetical protein [bacterium]
MAWISLALRHPENKQYGNQLTTNITEYSRAIRGVHRHLSVEQAHFNRLKKTELRDIKSEYMEVRDRRPDIKGDSAEYENWKVEYTKAQEDYQNRKADIEDYFDDVNSDLESDAQDEEDWWQQLQTQDETQIDAVSAEDQAIADSIKTEIDNAAIKL